jgi:L-ascorbate metabolism protein UlaG (beta-lactamase superfamily)/glycosyltransferase involved in cell wall biosynthesis
MTQNLRIPVQMLGQSGCRLGFPAVTVYLDPHLSNSLQLLDAPDRERLPPVPVTPEKVTDANIVLITRAHIAHCDPHTLLRLAQASPQAQFIGPAPVLKILVEWGIGAHRLALAVENWIDLAPNLRVRAVPAAHPEIIRDENAGLACVGYLIDFSGQRIYLAGATAARQEIVDDLVAHGPIHTAFLPVNEQNYFHNQRGIIGNMSVREAFQFASEIAVHQVVAMHWDKFAINAVYPEEIRLIHQRMNPGFSLLLRPTYLNLTKVKVSIVIRTLNEVQYLEALLVSIATQQTSGLNYEVVLVDSGSTDGTLQIAEHNGCRIFHITREEFSFGSSLNRGCEAALGEILVFTSGHCVPSDTYWLQRLCQPILDGKAEYAYGRQIGGLETHFSENRIFAKYFPDHSRIPQEGFYCNNANAALHKDSWEKYRFNEELTGLEDMELAQRLMRGGGRVAYIADAGVFHHHNESWSQVRLRFEREAIALQKIMPQLHVDLFDTLRYTLNSIWKDWRCSRRQKVPVSLVNLVRYRCNQYWGAHRGNQEHRRLSHAEKEKYFFPH